MTVKSPGRYPVKAKTPVADVCRYQNDGTATITPAKFIERAEEAANGWEDELDKAIAVFLAGGDQAALAEVARRIAADISKVCDRIDTGRLKASFEGRIN